MKIIHLTYRFLIILIFLIASFTVNGLELYQSVESDEQPELSPSLKQLEEYLESQDQRIQHHPHFIPHHRSSLYDNELLDYKRDEEKNILNLLVENSNILNTLKKERLTNYNNYEKPNYQLHYPRSSNIHEDSYINIDEQQEQEKQNPYNNYQRIKIPYAESQLNDKMFFDNFQRYPVRLSLHEWNDNYNENNNNNPIDKLQHKLLNYNLPNLKNIISKLSSVPEHVPEFTYQFDDINYDNSENNFAFKPNDPRFYQDDVINPEKNEDFQVSLKHDDNEDQDDEEEEEEEEDEDENKKTRSDVEKKDKIIIPMNLEVSKKKETKISEFRSNPKFFGIHDMVPEPHRRAEINPGVTSVLHPANNDAYFIAIVAGCSAAAMFALVLVSLTWCRLERGVKAAADIEYPAYGVTGPNKDISPSGDQRLAHSAQMYHFQHQKQQIIAMEKSAARDPGSVSEAESDEENEEGDYTVYECPGLAPAGEMEVKNPLFHDDPTPATPSQKYQDDDHH